MIRKIGKDDEELGGVLMIYTEYEKCRFKQTNEVV